MKTKYFESKPGTLVCALTGAEYKYTVSESASRQAAANKLAAHQSAELERTNQAISRRQQAVTHPETRTKVEIRAAQMAKHRRPQPAGARVVNPFEGAMERATARRGRLWAESESGRKYRLDTEAASADWEAKQQSKRQQSDFAKSIAPVVDHARANLDAVRNDPTATQLEVEQAEDRFKLAQTGDVAGYSTADKEWRQRQSEKIVAQAVEVDAHVRQLQAQRDALLKSAYEPVAEPTEPTIVDVYYPDFYHDPAKAGKTIKEPMPQGT